MPYVMQPLARSDQAPQDDDSSSRLALVSRTALESADDSGQGLALFVLFTIAVLVVTSAVGFLALLTSWWVLGVVFAVHVLVTVIVGTAVFNVLSTGKPSLATDDRAQLRPASGPDRQAQPRARSRQTSPIAA